MNICNFKSEDFTNICQCWQLLSVLGLVVFGWNIHNKRADRKWNFMVFVFVFFFTLKKPRVSSEFPRGPCSLLPAALPALAGALNLVLQGGCQDPRCHIPFPSIRMERERRPSSLSLRRLPGRIGKISTYISVGHTPGHKATPASSQLRSGGSFQRRTSQPSLSFISDSERENECWVTGNLAASCAITVS